MNLSRRQLLASLAAFPLPSLVRGSTGKLARKDCFFGLHFDLHPSKSDTDLGRDVTPAMVENLLARVQPDFVQYDCKGHAGYLGFKSRTGTSSPGIVKDSLEIWRRVTEQHGVGLYIHFSGVWDAVAVAEHPEWARVKPDGKPDDRLTSTFGPYVDKLMIPELEEAISRYSLDGAWIDGECWAVAPDYGERAQQLFRERTGVAELPRKKDDPGWLDFLELNREQFRRYVRHYIDELHRLHPGVQIASNYLYSSYVPEWAEIPVDFLSGDFLGPTPVSSARLEARYLASTEVPWDLMAWGFVSDRGSTVHKRPAQLEQEAAAVITQGGAFQIYHNPTRAGWIDDRVVDSLARIARFCAARREVSFKTKPVPQVAVLFSRHSLYSNTGRLFGGWGSAADPARGSVDALLAAGYSVEIIPDWKLADVAQYPVVVVPDWNDIGAAVREAVSGYARNGGTLILFGAANARELAALTGIRVTAVRERQSVVPGDSGFASVRGAWADVDPGSARVVGQRFPTYDTRANAAPGALAADCGSGKTVLIPGPIGTAYANFHAPALHEWLRAAMATVFRPMVEIEAPSHGVEVSVRRKGERLLVHLTNMTVMQAGPEFPVVDYVPPIGPLNVTVRLPARPSKVTWEPGANAVESTWQDGVLRASIPRLEIHGVIAID